MCASENRPFLTELTFPVKTYDIDFAGHVSNIVYIRWLEDLRLSLLERFLPLGPLMESGTVPMLTETSIKYRRQIGLFEVVHGGMWITDVKAVSVKLLAEFTTSDGVCAEAVQRGAFVDSATGRPTRVPSELHGSRVRVC